MGIAERFAAPPRKADPCKIGRILAGLDPKHRKLVEAALDSPQPVLHQNADGWSDQAIAEGLTDEHHPVSDSTVRHHRRRACTCYR